VYMSLLGPWLTIQVLLPSNWYQKSRTSNSARLSCILVPDCLVWYQKLGQNRTCTIASRFLVRDSVTSNLDGKLGSFAMDLTANAKLGNILLHMMVVSKKLWVTLPH